MPTIKSLTVAALLLLALPASSEVLLTADVYDTPGMPGFQTYDLVATSVGGYVNAFDFYGNGRGITGPLHQGGQWHDWLFADAAQDAADSHWLVGSGVGLSIGTSQSELGLNAAYSFTGVGGEKNTHRQLPFARLVTDDPTSVRIDGEFLIAERYTNTSPFVKQPQAVRVDLSLAEVPTGGAPVLGAFNDPVGPNLAEISSSSEAAWEAGWLGARAAAAETFDYAKLDSLARHRSATGGGSGEFDHEGWLAEEVELKRLASRQAIEESQQLQLDRLNDLQKLAELEAENSVDDQLELGVNLRQIGLGVMPINTSRLTNAAIRERLTPARQLSGLQRAMQTALTGLRAAETTIDYIGQATATPNTVGFKASEAVFTTDFLATVAIGSIERPTLDLSYAIDHDISVRITQPYELSGGHASAVIPEPAALGLAGLAMLALAVPRRITP